MFSKYLRLIIPLLLLVALAGGAWVLFAPRSAAPVQASVEGVTLPTGSATFQTASQPADLQFPRDFGPHPDYAAEWWYYTGNLSAADGRRFGYQLTFFRRAVRPAAERAPRPSDWGVEQIYMAHFTLTDVSANKFHYFERFERGSAGLAGATIDPGYQVWLRDWSVKQTGEGEYRLNASQDGVVLDLTLLDRKGPVLQGDQGYSQKGPQTGNASLYFSQTRLESSGKVTVSGQSFDVSGLSWMDREISTSALSKGQVGWDWFSLQFDDGSELMVYVLRRSDGTVDPFSSGTFIQPDGSTIPLKREDFTVSPKATWKSPHSGGIYPARWQVTIPRLDLSLEVQPLVADQELNVSFTYWEGAVQANGSRAGKAILGHGYVELTGYYKSMEGQL